MLTCILQRDLAHVGQFIARTAIVQPSTAQPCFVCTAGYGTQYVHVCCCAHLVAQALLSLPCLARDLGQLNCSSSSSSGGDGGGTGGSSSNPGSSGKSASKLQLPPDGVTAAMVTCLRQYQAACSR
jgi:hypothetical protein